MVVLVIEDDPVAAEAYAKACPKNVNVVIAPTRDAATMNFLKHRPEIVLIIVDGCLGGHRLNTPPLIAMLRRDGYTGRMVAAPSLNEDRAKMIDAGCNMAYNKSQLVEELPKILTESLTPRILTVEEASAFLDQFDRWVLTETTFSGGATEVGWQQNGQSVALGWFDGVHDSVGMDVTSSFYPYIQFEIAGDDAHKLRHRGHLVSRKSMEPTPEEETESLLRLIEAATRTGVKLILV